MIHEIQADLTSKTIVNETRKKPTDDSFVVMKMMAMEDGVSFVLISRCCED